MNLPIAFLSSGRSANRTSTLESISFNRKDPFRERRYLGTFRLKCSRPSRRCKTPAVLFGTH
jgi:hypothetical protein